MFVCMCVKNSMLKESYDQRIIGYENLDSYREIQWVQFLSLPHRFYSSAFDDVILPGEIK